MKSKDPLRFKKMNVKILNKRLGGVGFEFQEVNTGKCIFI